MQQSAQLNYLPLADEAARVLHQKLKEQRNHTWQQQPIQEHSRKIRYRFFVEKQWREFSWNDFPSNTNTWYHVCECLEMLYMKSIYHRIKNQKRIAVDPGAFVGFHEHELRSHARKKLTDHWRKSHMISPFYQFGENITSLVIVRIPRLSRLLWYNERFAHGWLFQLFARYPPHTSTSTLSIEDSDIKDEEENVKIAITEEEKLDQLIRDSQKVAVDASTIACSSLARRQFVRSSYVLQIPNDSRNNNNNNNNNHPVSTQSGRKCKGILPKLPHGIPRMFIRRLHQVQIDDAHLLQIYVYMDQDTECILEADLFSQ